jgi:two-component system phosphate regulon sensor histidine kinase PhoR
LKLKGKLYVIVTAVAAGCLITAGLAEFTVAARWRFGTVISIASACCLVAAAGVIWLSFCWIGLTERISSTAKLLSGKTDDRPLPAGSSKAKSGGIENLYEAIEQRLVEQSRYIARLEKDLEELQINTQLSHRQKSNIEAVIYSIRDAVIVIDEFDRLVLANESAGKLFGFDYQTSLHKPISELLGKEKNEFIDFLQQCRTSRAKASKHEITFLQDDRTKAFDCVVSCVYDPSKQVCGVVAVLHDITREKEISQMKNDFVSHVSHELKTPLASITAYSEMLLDDEADNEKTKKEFYSIIQNQANRLNRLIEDILNISRIESGLIKVEKTPVSMTVLLEEQMQMMKSYADEKNITLSWQQPIVFDQVYADKDMISQVIVNLLSNAIKYTGPGGSVRIGTEVDEIENLIRVSVTDTGVGIDGESIKHVFDKFYRVDATKNRAKGTGLGLNLVKQIVEKVHDGRVFAESRVGEGSTFGFELPLSRERVEAAGR